MFLYAYRLVINLFIEKGKEKSKLNAHSLRVSQSRRRSLYTAIILLSLATAWTVVFQHPAVFQARASFVNLQPMTLTVIAPDGTQAVLNETDIGNLTAYRAYGGYKNQLGNLRGLGNYTGVPINTFCEMVGGIRSGYSVYIIAADGYSKAMSYAELNGDVATYDNVTGEEVQHNETVTPILAYHYNDLNLSSSDGPLRAAIVGPEGLCTSSVFWVKQVVRLEIHANLQPMNLTIVALNGTELVLNETSISNLPALRAVGARRSQTGAVSGLGNYTGPSLNTLCDLVDEMSIDNALRVTAVGNYNKTLSYEEVSGAFATYDNATGQPVQHNQSLTPILAYHYNDANLSLSDGPLRMAIVGPEGLATTSSYWVKQIVKLEIRYRDDVAVTNITLSKAVMGQGFNCSIDVTVENQGGYTETFDLTLYANATVVATIQGLSLTNATSTTVAFSWNTTGFAKGNYTLGAVADTVPGETDTGDNTLADKWIIVTLPGDVEGDRDVDIFDIVKMAGVYGVSEPDPRYSPTCDIDCDGDVDIFDIVIAAGNYGKSW